MFFKDGILNITHEELREVASQIVNQFETAELTRKLNTDAGNISRWRTQQATPTRDNLLKLMEINPAYKREKKKISILQFKILY